MHDDKQIITYDDNVGSVTKSDSYTGVHLIRMHFFVGGSSILGRIRMLARPRV